MPQVGDTQVNATDYEGDIVIEQFDGHGRWAVPAWEERGVPELEGPFSTISEAREALRAYEAIWGD